MAYLDLSLRHNDAVYTNIGRQTRENYVIRLLVSLTASEATNQHLEHMCSLQQETITRLRAFEPPVPS